MVARPSFKYSKGHFSRYQLPSGLQLTLWNHRDEGHALATLPAAPFPLKIQSYPASPSRGSSTQLRIDPF